MNKMTQLSLGLVLAGYSMSSLAGGVPIAPEIDGAGIFLVLGIVISAVALVREKINKK